MYLNSHNLLNRRKKTFINSTAQSRDVDSLRQAPARKKWRVYYLQS